MRLLRAPRFWLMTSAAFILSAGANAQTSYQSGAPKMVAAAPGLPSISAEQIARDVTKAHNPRTGQSELIAAPFDPFEEDPALAGSVRLRSADGMRALDGKLLRDGVILEIDFYYNSPSDDPYRGRRFRDMSFVNGDLAPVTLRDSRVLECSTRVENVIYDHNSYYDRPYSRNIYRPYRHYTGHSGFGFGFGPSYYGPGYNASDRYRYRSRRSGFGFGSRSGLRGTRFGRRGHNSNRREGRRRDDNRGDRREHMRETETDTNIGSSGTRRRGLTTRQLEDRMRRLQSYGSEISRRQRDRRPRRGGSNEPRRMRGINPEPRLELAPAPTQSERQTTSRAAPRAATPRTEPTPRRETRSEPRRESRSSSRRVEPSRRDRSSIRTRPTRSIPSARRPSGRGSDRIRRHFDFFPGDDYGYGGRSIVSSRSVDCAREDKLRVFISNERLTAARFDGLTVIALDAEGHEAPIYIPPNYIEGYRLAARGEIRPQGYESAPPAPPQQVTPQYFPPSNPVLESAPCPSGTTKQSDGTCLLSSSDSGVVGYPRP